MERINATATVLTYNSARTIATCLASLGAFAEILVLDGGSSDGTQDVARSFGARVESQSGTPGPISDFTAVRERSFFLAAHDWIFVVDSDEIADHILIDAIVSTVGQNDPHRAYRVERVPIVAGRLIRHAYFSPDFILRLVHRRAASWAKGKRVHEHLVPHAEVRVLNLPGSLTTTWPSLEVARGKDSHYLALAFSRTLTKRPTVFVTCRAVFKNAIRAVGIILCSVWLRVQYPSSSLPLSSAWRFARYHAIVARERVRQFFYGISYHPPSF